MRVWRPQVVGLGPLVLAVLAVILALPAMATARPQRKHRRHHPATARKKHHQAPAPRGQKSSPPDPGQKSSPPETRGQKSSPPATKPPAKNKVQEVDFTGLDIAGRLHTPQLLYFLDRVKEELGRASLERRSFLPELYRSVKEDPL